MLGGVVESKHTVELVNRFLLISIWSVRVCACERSTTLE